MTTLQAEANALREAERAKWKQAWKLSCEQVADQDRLLVTKEEEIARLQEQLAAAAVAPHAGAGGRLTEPAAREPPRSTASPLPPVGAPIRATRTVTPASTPASRVIAESPVGTAGAGPPPRRGKAPPVELFGGENAEIRLEDWLPSLQRAAQWNEWYHFRHS